MDRDEFMNLVYDELHSDGDNNRANRIIEAADEYVESALLGTNLAEVRTDTISRQAAIKTAHLPTIEDAGYEVIRLDDILALPSAQPDNQVHLCDSCSYTYPDCPSVYTDVIFGNGIGNDNICACSKYLPSAQPEIVYCKDCKYSEYHKLYGDRFCLYNNGADVVPNLHFCGYAERKENERKD